MRTSVQLLDDCGNTIHDFYVGFRLTGGVDGENGDATPTVARLLVIEGEVSTSSEVALDRFVQVVDRPFDISASDCVYLNADCVYDDEVLAAVERHAGGVNRIPIEFVRALPPQVDGLGLALTGSMRMSFVNGSPIWSRGARSCAPTRGRDGQMTVTKALRDAIRGWSVIAEQTARHAFRRARRQGADHWNDAAQLARTSEDVISCGLGYYPDGRRFDTSVPAREVRRLELARFKFDAARIRGRKHQFAPLDARVTDRKGYLFADNPERFSDQIEQDIAMFETLHPGEEFDAFAVAAWAASILVSLRVSYTTMLNVDQRRSAERKKILAAQTPADLQFVADQFTFTPYLGMPGRKTNGEYTRVRFTDIVGPQDAALVAFLADIEPRLINTEFCPFDRKTQDALLGTARWLGVLYRQRSAFMTLAQAEMYFHLLSEIDMPLAGGDAGQNAQDLGSAFGTICSFLSPQGRARIEAGARSVIADGLPRTVYAVTVELDDGGDDIRPIGRPGALARLLGQNTGAHADRLPPPIFVPAGRLLLPGDYAEAWLGRNDDLLDTINGID